jgi:hypothetical protein
VYFFGAEVGFALLILNSTFEVINYSAFTLKNKTKELCLQKGLPCW